MRTSILTAFLLFVLIGTASADDTVMSHSACKSPDITVKPSHGGDVLFVHSRPAPAGLPLKSTRTIAEVNDYFHVGATTEKEAVVAVCDATTTYGEIVNFLRFIGYRGTFIATPEVGGSVVLGDGTALSIPAGAVSVPTEIRVTSEASSDPSLNGKARIVRLEPDGLQLAVPARMTVPFALGEQADGTIRTGSIASSLNPRCSVRMASTRSSSRCWSSVRAPTRPISRSITSRSCPFLSCPPSRW